MEEITIERIILEEIEVLPPPGLSELLSIKVPGGEKHLRSQRVTMKEM
ncbi:hypothetical protein [Rossellomorea marisflavi]